MSKQPNPALAGLTITLRSGVRILVQSNRVGALMKTEYRIWNAPGEVVEFEDSGRTFRIRSSEAAATELVVSEGSNGSAAKERNVPRDNRAGG